MKRVRKRSLDIRVVLVIMLSLAALFLASQINEEQIYLSPGTEINSCGIINESGQYFLNKSIFNITGTCLYINASDVIIDMMGNDLAGNITPGSGGVDDSWLTEPSSIEYTPCIIEIRESNNLLIYNGSVSSASCALMNMNSYGSQLIDLNIKLSDIGIFTVNSTNSNYSNIDIRNSSLGIIDLWGNNNNIAYLFEEDNVYGVSLIESKNINMNSFGFWRNFANLILSNTSYTNINDLNITNGFVGIAIAESQYNTFSNIETSGIFASISIINSSNNIFTGLKSNEDFMYATINQINETLFENLSLINTTYGFKIGSSSLVNVRKANIYWAEEGVRDERGSENTYEDFFVGNSSYGLYIDSCKNCLINNYTTRFSETIGAEIIDSHLNVSSLNERNNFDSIRKTWRIYMNVSNIFNEAIDEFEIRIYNSTKNLILTKSFFYVSPNSGTGDGGYEKAANIEIYQNKSGVVYDALGNNYSINVSADEFRSLSRNFTVMNSIMKENFILNDNVSPYVSISASSITRTSAEMSLTARDYGVGIKNCTAFIGSIRRNMTSDTLQSTFTVSGLSSNTTYIYYAICFDREGNMRTSINKTFTTLSSTINPSPGPQPEPEPPYAGRTLYISTNQMLSGYSASIQLNDTLRMSLSSGIHNLKLIGLGPTSAYIKLDATNMLLTVNNTKEIDFNNDSVNDLIITINSISGVTSRISVQEIFEPVVVVPIPQVNNTNMTLPPLNLTNAGDGDEDEINSLNFFKDNKRIILFVLVIVIVVVLIIIGFIIFDHVRNSEDEDDVKSISVNKSKS